MKNFAEIKRVAGLPSLSSPAEEVAEELIFLVHEGIDWEVWGGTRLKRYWDALSERVRAATYAGPSLDDWWDDISVRISSAPKSATNRARVVELVGTVDNKAVLRVLRNKGAVLVLRLRVALEVHRESQGE